MPQSSGGDRIYGESNAAALTGAGADGNDTIHGEAGNDFVRGNSGHDTIYGDDGVDLLFGDQNNDRLEGGDETAGGGPPRHRAVRLGHPVHGQPVGHDHEVCLRRCTHVRNPSDGRRGADHPAVSGHPVPGGARRAPEPGARFVQTTRRERMTWLSFVA